MIDDAPVLWTQFRRLLLGTAVELFRDADVRVDMAALRLEFEPESLFHYPSLNSQMRFVGTVRADVLTPPTRAALDAVEHALVDIWPTIVAQVRVPMIGAMTVSTNEVTLELDGDQLCVGFDLAAD